MTTALALSDYEQERGKPMPSWNHGLAQAYLTAAILRRYEQEYLVVTELSLELAEGRPLVPDISIYPKSPNDWQHDVVQKTEPPLTVVEILSPRQGMDELIHKADAYFEAGVKSCWIVQPMLESVAVLRPGAKPKVYTAGAVTDPATGITVETGEIFR